MPRENIHINVYEQNIKEIDSDKKSSEKYIILMNEELNNKNKDLLIQITQYESTIEDLENDFDREEKKTIYMRGLLKNIYNLNSIEKRLNKEYKKELNKLSNRLIDFANLILRFPTIFIGLHLVLFMFDYTLLDFIIICILYLLTFFSSYYFTTNRFFNKKDLIVETNYPIINSIIDEIQRLEKNNDNINEFIDCI